MIFDYKQEKPALFKLSKNKFIGKIMGDYRIQWMLGMKIGLVNCRASSLRGWKARSTRVSEA